MQFTYIAKTAQGSESTGDIDASSTEEVARMLQNQNLIVISIQPKRKKEAGLDSLPFINKITPKEIVIFSRQLATLAMANVAIVESLEVLARQQDNKKFKVKLQKIAQDVSGGMTMSQALNRHPDVFSKFFIAMVKVGEATGNVAKVFNYLADYLEEDYETKAKIKGAMTYPGTILVAFLLVGVVLMIYVLPQLTSMFEEVERDLPLITQVIVTISNFSQNYWYLLILIVFGAPSAIVWFFFKTAIGRRVWDVYSFKIPVIGRLLRNIYLARFAESMATLIKGGLPMVETITVTRDVINNSIYKEIITQLKKEVESGNKMADVLAQHPEEFPVMLTQLIRVGEATGKSSETLMTAARFYKREVTHMAENMTQLLEPVMIIFLGIVIGLLVVGILLPIYDFSVNGIS